MERYGFMERLADWAALSPQLRAELPGLLLPEKFRARQLWRAGAGAHSRVWYVEEGLLFTYYLDEAGQMVVTGFFMPGDFILLYENRSPENGSEYLQALQPSALQSLPFSRLEYLLNRYPEVRALAGRVLRGQQRRAHYRMRLLAMPARPRYVRFRRDFPAVFRLVSLRLIASYLGMTRENLSRLIGRER
jgi:CRP/FNR family transcriptional regulator, anaerobic regulatory protein